MADLSTRTPARITRKQREQRAYRLSAATGVGALGTVATLVLSILGVVGFGIVLLFAILTVVSGLMLKRTLNL
jgi:hypothetical protein